LDGKNKEYGPPEKILLLLLVLRGIEGISRDFHFRFALITVRIESITGADKKGHDAKNLQVEKEGGRMHPAIRDIL
jgi:hypothetical protein